METGSLVEGLIPAPSFRKEGAFRVIRANYLLRGPRNNRCRGVDRASDEAGDPCRREERSLSVSETGTGQDHDRMREVQRVDRPGRRKCSR